MEELVPITIDLSEAKRGELNESFLRMFGGAIKGILDRMFGGPKIPVTVRGSKSEISSFAKVLGREKKYMQAFHRYGLDDPRVIKNKYKLKNAINGFERTTGIPYPFK